MRIFAGGYKIWKQGFYFAAIPIIILGHVNAFGMSDGSEHEPPPFVPYDHLRLRSKVTLTTQLEIFLVFIGFRVRRIVFGTYCS